MLINLCFFNVLDSFSSQLKQLADSTGFSTNYTDQGTGAIDAYLEKKLPDSVFKDAVTYGKIRSRKFFPGYLI